MPLGSEVAFPPPPQALCPPLPAHPPYGKPEEGQAPKKRQKAEDKASTQHPAWHSAVRWPRQPHPGVPGPALPAPQGWQGRVPACPKRAMLLAEHPQPPALQWLPCHPAPQLQSKCYHPTKSPNRTGRLGPFSTWAFPAPQRQGLNLIPTPNSSGTQ